MDEKDVVIFDSIEINPLGVFKNPEELIACLRKISQVNHDSTHQYVDNKAWPGTCEICCWIDSGTNFDLVWKVKLLIRNQKRYPVTRNIEWVAVAWYVAKTLGGLKTNLPEEFTKKCDLMYENRK